MSMTFTRQRWVLPCDVAVYLNNVSVYARIRSFEIVIFNILCI